MNTVPVIPENKLPAPWNLSGPLYAQPEGTKKYEGTGNAFVAVSRMGAFFRVMAKDGKQTIEHEDVANIEDANNKAIAYMKSYDDLLKQYKSAVMESALSFTEKRSLQKSVGEGVKQLKGGGLSFTEKRGLQKSVAEGVAKLKGTDAPKQDDSLEAEFSLDKRVAEARSALTLGPLTYFIGKSQREAMMTAMTGEERKFFVEMVEKLITLFDTMPKVYEQDGKGDSAVISLHYFKGGSDWYITERDTRMEQEQAFGYAILNGDKQNAEMGYISIQELIDLGVELDLYWKQKTLAQIKGTKEEPEPGLQPEKGTPTNQRLADLLAGKFINKEPEVFIGILTDIAGEISEWEAVKPAATAYLDLHF